MDNTINLDDICRIVTDEEYTLTVEALQDFTSFYGAECKWMNDVRIPDTKETWQEIAKAFFCAFYREAMDSREGFGLGGQNESSIKDRKK